MFNKQLREDLEQIKKQINLGTTVEFVYDPFWGGKLPRLKPMKLGDAIDSIESRLDHQEKMQRMLFAHLGIEYAKTTEETSTGKQEKEVLRRVKRQGK